jgi:hypothetical protein
MGKAAYCKIYNTIEDIYLVRKSRELMLSSSSLMMYTPQAQSVLDSNQTFHFGRRYFKKTESENQSFI